MNTPSIELIITEAVRRIVTETNPLRVILFGSAARGDMGPDSDLDFLVVMPGGADCLSVTGRIHRILRGLDCPKDVVVVLETDMAAHAQNPALIIHTALTEGRELYHAA
jgi:predicted nucleotidyltransferase